MPTSYLPLDTFDNVPVEDNNFTAEFIQWITNQINILNYDIILLNQTIADINARLIAGGL